MRTKTILKLALRRARKSASVVGASPPDSESDSSIKRFLSQRLSFKLQKLYNWHISACLSCSEAHIDFTENILGRCLLLEPGNGKAVDPGILKEYNDWEHQYVIGIRQNKKKN